MGVGVEEGTSPAPMSPSHRLDVARTTNGHYLAYRRAAGTWTAASEKESYIKQYEGWGITKAHDTYRNSCLRELLQFLQVSLNSEIIPARSL